MTTTQPTDTKPPKPVPCRDRVRCKNPAAFLVECGNVDTGHMIGGTSCAKHLGDTVAYAATLHPVVRVLGAGATWEQKRVFEYARGGPYAARQDAENALVSS
jgi:hypothetical protein